MRVSFYAFFFNIWSTHSAHASVRNARVLHKLGGSRKYDLVTHLT